MSDIAELTQAEADLLAAIAARGTSGTGSGGGGGGSGVNATLSHSVTLVGTSLGAKPAGYTFAAGTTFTAFVDAICTNVIHPTYTAPTLSISSSQSTGNTEVGTIANIALSKTFAQNNAGAMTAQRLYKNGSLLASTFPYTDTGMQFTLSPVTYQGQVDYGTGAILNDNTGTPDATGQITAGTISSNTFSYVGKRMAFYGTPTSTPANSAAVRALTGSFNSSNGNSFTIAIPPGATRVTFAYPADRQAVTSVKYVELSNTEVKGNFTETSVSVEGANGYSAVAYRVFTYVPVEPFTQAVNYTVTI